MTRVARDLGRRVDLRIERDRELGDVVKERGVGVGDQCEVRPVLSTVPDQAHLAVDLELVLGLGVP